MLDPTKYKLTLEFEATKLELEALSTYMKMNRIESKTIAKPEAIEITIPHCKECGKLLHPKDIREGLYICLQCKNKREEVGNENTRPEAETSK